MKKCGKRGVAEMGSHSGWQESHREGQESHRKGQNLTESFLLSAQASGRKLDERTVHAYRTDLERFYRWMENGEEGEAGRGAKEADVQRKGSARDVSVSAEMEAYLDYLAREKGLRSSTICRKTRVFRSYLVYLASQGVLEPYRPLRPVSRPRKTQEDTALTKQEVEALFRAIDREYEGLESDFRRRVCLRDQVMMKLLFYHGIEVSELLDLKLSDYDRKTAALRIRGKRGKSRCVRLFSRSLAEQMGQWLSEHGYFEHGGEGDREDDSFLFLSKLGKPLSMKMVILIFEKYRKLAGIEKECRPKDLKHSLERYGVELVMEQCG